MSKTRSSIYTPGSGFVAIFAFMLTAVPRMNVKIGPIPIYLIDLVIFLMLYAALRAPAFGAGKRPFVGLVALILAFAVLSEGYGFLLSGGSPEAVYVLGRTLLAFSVFYSVGQLIRTPGDLERILKAALIGLLITASLMILTSLPMTRSIASSIAFASTFLEPAAESSRLISRFFETSEAAQRGRTLVGVSILGATFINACWPLAALLAVWPYAIGMWRRVAVFACLIAPLAVLMSYSRGPIIGTILMILMVLILRLGHLRRSFIIPIVAGVIGIAAIGVDSELFFFDRLVNRTQAMLDDPFSDERESERVLAYVEPFVHVMENPRYFFMGEGVEPSRVGVPSERGGKATHALFAVAYYSYGMIAAFLYHLLIISVLYYAFWHMRHRRAGVGMLYSYALLLSTLALLPWFAFGHAAVSAPRGAMMLFFVLGMLASLRHFPIHRPQAENLSQKVGRPLRQIEEASFRR